MANHPHQPIETNAHGVRRFKCNTIVSYLLDCCQLGIKADMNSLAMLPFTDDDRVQFAQLIGYSVCGFSELSYVSDEAFRTATDGEER